MRKQNEQCVFTITYALFCVACFADVKLREREFDRRNGFAGLKKLFELEDEMPLSGCEGGDRQSIARSEQRH